MFFLSFRERFGLPIVELQQCGSYIVAPYKDWVPSHYMKDVYESGLGELTDNFIVYEGNKELLKEHISRVKASFDATSVVDRFKKSQPHLYCGDRAELARFIDMIRAKDITSNSHESYSIYNEKIALRT